MDDAQYRRLLKADERDALPMERLADTEARERRLRSPVTNLGSGRGRFRVVLDRLLPLLPQADKIGDVGVYPGTTPRLIRSLPAGAEISIAGLGLGFDRAFTKAMSRLGVALHEVELDLRRPPADGRHLLTCPPEDIGGPYDITVCTEVIEHQMHPASLLVGLNAATAPGGTALLTTNSVSFVGDIAKLMLGRQNVEALHRSHVISDSDWRPHIRLYTARELRELFELAGFTVSEATYFDNGNVYRGVKGAAMASLRAVASLAPHWRSHVLVVARRTGEPDPMLVEHLRRMVDAHGLSELLAGRPCGCGS